MVRTRIAPSPTGYPHIGTIYQALFNFAFAKKYNGKFFVRIEDTDRTRFVEGAEDKIYEALDWFCLSEDESPRKEGKFGPYRQSERLETYKKYAIELVGKGHAYYCFCTPSRLEELRKKLQSEKKIVKYDKKCLEIKDYEARIKDGEQYVIRLNVPENETIIFNDEIRGEIKFDSNIVDDQVILKSDGFPTYHLAVVVDDHLMQTSHILRGEEWLSSTPKHILLYKFFGWEMPPIYHTPLLRNPDHSKLSKRHSHTSVDWYRQEGFLPEAILNFLALMGWSHPSEKEVFALDEFIKLFDLKDLKSVGPIFDLQKLIWMNGIYIRELQISDFKSLISNFYPRKYSEEFIEKVFPVVRERIKTLKEFSELIDPFLEKRNIKLTDYEKALKKELHEVLAVIEKWDNETITECLKQVASKNSIKFKAYYKILFGISAGLPLGDMFAVIGEEKTLDLFS